MKFIGETETTVIAKHDGYTFIFGKGAAVSEVLGCYIDNLGIVQNVLFGSLYAEHNLNMKRSTKLPSQLQVQGQREWAEMQKKNLKSDKPMEVKEVTGEELREEIGGFLGVGMKVISEFTIIALTHHLLTKFRMEKKEKGNELNTSL